MNQPQFKLETPLLGSFREFRGAGPSPQKGALLKMEIPAGAWPTLRATVGAVRSAGRGAVYVFLALAFCALIGGAAGAASAQPVSKPLLGTVKDALGRPVPGVTLILEASDGRTIARATTNDRGLFRLAKGKAGTYAVVARKKGFKAATRIITLPDRTGEPLQLVLESEEALTLSVSASRRLAQNGISTTGTSKYTMTARDLANLPAGEATPLNQALLQMPGVALDQNQEIHVRDQHVGPQYQIDGVLLPLDVNTDPTFTQLLNAYFVKSVSLLDGILPARFGYRGAVIDIHTKDGCEGDNNNFTIYGGQRDTVQPSFQIRGCDGKFSYYLTGLYLRSNLGFSSATPAPDPIHDATNQGQGFAHLTYQISPLMKLSLITGMTVASNQFPNRSGLPPLYELNGVNPAAYPATAIDSGLDQQDYYGVLALNGVIGSNLDYQLAYSAHYNAQTFNPDPIGDLIYQGVSSHVFNSDLANTLEGDVTYRVGKSNTLATGFYFGEYGAESDDRSLVFSVNGAGKQISDVPITVRNDLNKINLLYGLYMQDTWEMTEALSVNFGSRWDRITGLSNGSQFSPTINLVYKARPDTTLHAGFARYFQVPNFQGIAPDTSATFAGTSGAVGSNGNASPFPETDYYWDVGFIERLTPHLTYALDNYFRIAHHYLDEGNFGFVPLNVPFNYVRGYGWGTENSLTYNIGDLSLRSNLLIASERIIGIASGQYNVYPAELAYMDRHYFVADHAPLVTGSGGAAYRWGAYQFTVDGLYSSGLHAGFANQNQLPNVWQFNLSAARYFDVPKLGRFEDRIVLLNVFDRTNLIRPPISVGSFQAAYGPRIAVFDALSFSFPSF